MWFLIFALFCEFSSGEQYQEPDAIQFPRPISSGEENLISSNSSDLVKSLQIARRLNTLESIDDYLDIVQGAPRGLASSRSGIVKRSARIRAQPALCMPETQTVPVVEETDPSVIYLPECTRVKRCGGCCLHKLLSCQPTEKRIVEMEINVASVEDTGLKFKKKILVPVEEHTKCRCLCRIQASHCTEKQDYLEDECRCQCRNLDEKERCQASDVRKAWNPELCACQCQEVRTCSSRFFFDQNTCSCRELTIAQWLIDDRTGYNFRSTSGNSRDRSPLIVPLDSYDSRRRSQPDNQFK